MAFPSSSVAIVDQVLRRLARAKNTATAAAMAKLLRGSLKNIDDLSLYASPDLDRVVENYEGLMIDMLALTKRPTSRGC